MKLRITDYSETVKGLELGLRRDEIEQFISLLRELADGKFDYFTIATNNYDLPFVIENFQLYLDSTDEAGNMQILGGAIPAED